MKNILNFIQETHNVIHCKTKEDNIKFLTALAEQTIGSHLAIATQHFLSSNIWGMYGETTGYRICASGIRYSPIDYYQREGYNIIEVSALLHDCELCDIYNTCNKERCTK